MADKFSSILITKITMCWYYRDVKKKKKPFLCKRYWFICIRSFWSLLFPAVNRLYNVKRYTFWVSIWKLCKHNRMSTRYNIHTIKCEVRKRHLQTSFGFYLNKKKKMSTIFIMWDDFVWMVWLWCHIFMFYQIVVAS